MIIRVGSVFLLSSPKVTASEYYIKDRISRRATNDTVKTNNTFN